MISNVIGFGLYDKRFDFSLFQSVENGYGMHPWWFFPHWKSSNLTTHFHLVLWLQMNETGPALPHVLLWHAQNVPLPLPYEEKNAGYTVHT
jgi:hypothetical protein